MTRADLAAPDDRPASRCPRCGGAFHCGRHDPTPCHCTAVALDAGTLAELRRRYTGCLCGPCLHELARVKLSPIDQGIH